MKKIISLILLMLMMTTLLVSCDFPIRKATEDDIEHNLNNASYQPIYFSQTLCLTWNPKVNINNLTLQFRLIDRDGKVLKSQIWEVGDVEAGTQHLYFIDVSDIVATLTTDITYEVSVINGYVIQR